MNEKVERDLKQLPFVVISTLRLSDSIDNARAERLANICFILCFHNPLRDRASQTGRAGRGQLAWFSRAGVRTLESFES